MSIWQGRQIVRCLVIKALVQHRVPLANRRQELFRLPEFDLDRKPIAPGNVDSTQTSDPPPATTTVSGILRWLGCSRDLAMHAPTGSAATEEMASELKRVSRDHEILPARMRDTDAYRDFLSQGGRLMTFRFIDQAKEELPAYILCKNLGVRKTRQD